MALADFEDQLAESYAAREYVVQYRESDFGFVGRILEHAGIYYYFRHEENRHVLVLADAASAHATAPDYETMQFHPQGTADAGGDEFLNRWEVAHQWRSGAYASDDFDFERPRADLTAPAAGQRQAQEEAISRSSTIPPGTCSRSDIEGYVRARLTERPERRRGGERRRRRRGVWALAISSRLTGFPNESQNKQYLVIACVLRRGELLA